MKCSVPEIAWHNREPVLAVSFQPSSSPEDILRLASGGADSHLLIWYVRYEDDTNVCLEIVADLARHQKAINAVQWSPSGELLASGDDESIIIIWKQKTDVDPPQLFEQTGDDDKEIWLQYKVLRGHLEDIYDISWCPFGNFLVSGSVDNTAFVWDVHKGKTTGVLTDHKGFVQGVSWDPKNQYIATMCSDSVFRLFDINTKKIVSRSTKAALPVPSSHKLHGQSYKLFYDGSLQSYFRRLDYSPNGELVAVPTGFIESNENGTVTHFNMAFIYRRSNMKSPICMLPCGESPSLIVRWSPIIYKLRENGPSPLVHFPSPIRLVLAIATKAMVLIYDTQQATPIAVLTNMHYTRLTDLTWSSDGNLLVISSTDGFCSLVRFLPGELGVATESDVSNKENVINGNQNTTPNKKNEITPKSKNSTPSTKRKNSTDELKNDIAIVDEAAMEPWSQDGVAPIDKSASPVKIRNDVDESTEDIKMVFEDTETDFRVENKMSINDEVEVTPMPPKVVEAPQALPKTPRRVNFITLSSPKNPKKPQSCDS